MAAGQTDLARQVLGDSLAAATKIGWTDRVQQINELLNPPPGKRGDMIIQLESATTENLEAARRSLEAMAHGWGHEIAEAPAEATPAAGTSHDDDGKVIDPVSVATLVVSIPPAVLAVRRSGRPHPQAAQGQPN